ncbi:MAG: hypothetical protein L0I79_01925 [Atopostipes sp.]|nr:hypothetical protein [Atopostipes sp.]
MVFERKEKEELEAPKEVKTYFWTFLKWTWIALPSIYFVIALPGILERAEGALSLFDLTTLFFQILNFVMAGNMFLIEPSERSRSGVADKFLKIGALQQFFAENIFGLILILLAWYQLPKVLPNDYEVEEKDMNYLKPKTNLVITIVSTILSFAIMLVRIILI